MRPRPALITVIATIVLALLLSPLAPVKLLEPNEPGTERAIYIFVVVFLGIIALVGWGIGYYRRGGGVAGLVRYTIGNVVMGTSLLFILISAWAAADMADGLICVFGVVPLIWLGAVLARWQIVNDDRYNVPDDIAHAAYDFDFDPPPQKAKHVSDPERLITLHGQGTDVTQPVFIEAGTYQIRYAFHGAESVDGCEVTLINVDDPQRLKQSIATPESSHGAMVFVIQESSRHVFEVDGVNNTGDSLTWEITIDRL